MLAVFVLAAMANGCNGATPSVVAVSLQSVTRTPYLNRYRISATVRNQGNAAQTGDTLQFLDVVYYGGRIDARGIPPLRPGESYTVSYVWPRSVDAGRGTSPVGFRIRPISPMPLGACSNAHGSAGITV